MGPARGLDPETRGVRGGPAHGLGCNGSVTPYDAQGGNATPPPQTLRATSPSLTARHDSVGDLGHGVTITLPADTIFCVLCSRYVGTVLLADNHFKSTHGGIRIRYECDICHMFSYNHHSVSCHVPKCRGLRAPSDSGTTPAVHCEACGRGFGSDRALSTHECHVHPEVRNGKRIRQARMLGGPTGWTEQEVAHLNQLLQEHAGDPQATSRVAAQFLDKSYEQVRSKIRYKTNLYCFFCEVFFFIKGFYYNIGLNHVLLV